MGKVGTRDEESVGFGESWNEVSRATLWQAYCFCIMDAPVIIKMRHDDK